MTMPATLETEHAQDCARAVAEVAFASLKGQPAGRQLLICSGLNLLLGSHLPQLAQAANQIAENLRRAEAAQLVFADLLK